MSNALADEVLIPYSANTTLEGLGLLMQVTDQIRLRRVGALDLRTAHDDV
jgi:hypothetical protein